jgi:leucyl/phenylalanyl-tRNA--protein transferase
VIFDLDGTPADIGFPDTQLAESDPNGLLAIGGDLSQARLLSAYRQGIFPWYSAGQPILWWSPAPRMVLFPEELHVSRSLRRSMRRSGFSISIDLAFEAVIRACAAPRSLQEGTWLLPEMVDAYQTLNRSGHAHSFEVWHGDDLVGGLYGVAIGQLFFGESMFSRRSDASKIALSLLAEVALAQPYRLIDCQVYTAHLSRLGAREIPRAEFQRALTAAVDAPAAPLMSRPRRSAGSLRWAT